MGLILLKTGLLASPLYWTSTILSTFTLYNILTVTDEICNPFLNKLHFFGNWITSAKLFVQMKLLLVYCKVGAIGFKAF